MRMIVKLDGSPVIDHDNTPDVRERLRARVIAEVAAGTHKPLALRARLGTGLCQVDFAQAFEVDVADLRAWEAGEADPPADVAQRLRNLGPRRLVKDRPGHWRLA